MYFNTSPQSFYLSSSWKLVHNHRLWTPRHPYCGHVLVQSICICIYIQTQTYISCIDKYTGQEALWDRVFDPVYIFLFDLYHYIRTKVHFSFVSIWVSRCWNLVGFSGWARHPLNSKEFFVRHEQICIWARDPSLFLFFPFNAWWNAHSQPPSMGTRTSLLWTCPRAGLVHRGEPHSELRGVAVCCSVLRPREGHLSCRHVHKQCNCAQANPIVSCRRCGNGEMERERKKERACGSERERFGKRYRVAKTLHVPHV